ncbi:MAG: UDP-N-acetylmuramoyl-L-alanine--D-glutamate ligase [Anaerolineales bacterium]
MTNRRMDYSGKRVVILGLARQGVALARYLAEAGARVTVSDAQPAEQLATAIESLRDLTIEYVLGGHTLSRLDGADLLCLSGGVDAGIPLARQARARGIQVSNDSQIFLEVCPARNTVGITGSAGKTTTTTLVGRMLSLTPRSPLPQGEGGRTWVGGNIGHPLIADVARMTADDTAVMELSSFQLEIMTRSTRVAAILNITPNHLDRHSTMDVYIAAKSNLLRYQPPDGIAVLGWDNEAVRGLASSANGRVMYFSGDPHPSPFGRGSRFAYGGEGVYMRGERVIWRWAGREHDVCRVSEIGLRGHHNVLNVLAACAISGAAGGDIEQMRAGIHNFTGVEHRLEFIRERAGVRWYNDSIATAPERVIAALHSFDEPVVLLLGGRDKKLPWDELARLVKERVKHTVLFGEAAPLIQHALEAEKVTAFTRCERLREAVTVATQHAEGGEVVLLSPGCTGFDEFKDFAERGEKYRQWVNEL